MLPELVVPRVQQVVEARQTDLESAVKRGLRLDSPVFKEPLVVAAVELPIWHSAYSKVPEDPAVAVEVRMAPP